MHNFLKYLKTIICSKISKQLLLVFHVSIFMRLVIPEHNAFALK